MILIKRHILVSGLTLLALTGIAQKRGTLVIEPETVPVMTTLGPVVTDGIYPSMLCDSVTKVQTNDPSITVTGYDMAIEMSRPFLIRVRGNALPDTVCWISKRLRGEEIIFIENVTGVDSQGIQVKLPPVRLLVLRPGGRIDYDYDEADPVDPRE